MLLIVIMLARLIVLGDSIGVGLGASTPSHAFAAIVATHRGMQLDNRAIVGSTLATEPIPADLHPGDTVIWLTGYNDMRAGHDPIVYGAMLRADVQAMVAQGAAVELAGCLPMADYSGYGPDWDHGNAALVAAYTAQIRAVPGAIFIPLVYDPANVAPDGVHPNDRGHAQIAAAFLHHAFYLPI